MTYYFLNNPEAGCTISVKLFAEIVFESLLSTKLYSVFQKNFIHLL